MSTTEKMFSLLTRAERRSAAMLLGLMTIGMIFETLGVGLVIPAVGLMMQKDLSTAYPALRPAIESLGNPSEEQLLVGGMLALVLFFLAKTLFLALLVSRQSRFSFAVQADLSQRLFATYLRQPYMFHLQRNSSELVQNAMNEVGIFARYGITPAMLLLTEVLVLIGVGGLLLSVEPLGAVIVVAVVGGASWGFHRVTQARVSHWGEARQVHEARRMLHLQQGLGGVKDLKVLGREREFLDQYSVHNWQAARVGQLQETLHQLPRLWLELLAVTGLASLVISMLAQNRAMTSIIPTLSLFAAAAFRLMPSVNRVLGAVQRLRYSKPVIYTLHHELGLVAPEQVDGRSGLETDRDQDINLEAITYTYPAAAKPALIGLDIKITRGESIGFIGPSGSGKSTLVDVLLGLLTPSSGRVTVGGEDIHQNIRGWQNQIGYVPQAIYLTDDTLRRNVAFGLSDAEIDDSAVHRAIRASQLAEFVGELPNKLETLVGERGIRLSGGQRQRIGIARALYHDPAVLVLDEATSALDADTEADVMQAVSALQGEKTLVIVAHRFSTVDRCSRLYRLEDGKVVAEGNPDVILGLRTV